MKKIFLILQIIIITLGLETLSAREVKYETKEAFFEAFNQEYSCPLMFASDALKKNRELVLYAMGKQCFIKDANSSMVTITTPLQFADEVFRSDKEIVLKALSVNPYALKYADDSFKNDRVLVSSLIEDGFGELLEYVGEELKKEKEFVRFAMKNANEQGYIFQYADKSLKSDKAFVLKIMNEHDGEGSIFPYIDKSLQKEKEVIETAFETANAEWDVFCSVDDSLLKDKTFVFKSLKKYNDSVTEMIDCIDDSLKLDNEFILKLIKEIGTGLKYATIEQQDNKEIVLEAVKLNGSELQYASERLRDDREVLLQTISQLDVLRQSGRPDALLRSREEKRKIVSANDFSL